MDVFDDPLIGRGDTIGLVRQMIRLGDPEQAAALLREYVQGGGHLGEASEVAFELRDMPLLRRLAMDCDGAGERWAQILVDDSGVEAAAAQMAALPEQPAQVPWWLRSPRRLQFAVALHRCGHHQVAVDVAHEVLIAEPEDSRTATRATWLLAEAHAALDDLDALRDLADKGMRHAQGLYFQLLGERDDVAALSVHADRGHDEAIRVLNNVLYRRGDIDGLARGAEAGQWTAALLLPRLLMERGERDRVAELAEAGNSHAQHALAVHAADEDDLDTLRDLESRGYVGADQQVVKVLVRRADVGGLRARADGGDPRAYEELVSLLVRHGDAVRLRALALAIDDDTAAWALASVLIQRGDVEEAAVVLRSLVPTDLDPPLRRAAEDLVDQLDLDTLRRVLAHRHPDVYLSGSLSAAEWIVMAVSAGVLGNAAYAALAAAISKLWERSAAKNPAPAPPVAAEPANSTPDPARHSQRQALSIACLAIHDHCTAIEATIPDFANLQYEVLSGNDGRWLFHIQETGGRRFTVRIPPPRPGTNDVVVTMYASSRTIQPGPTGPRRADSSP